MLKEEAKAIKERLQDCSIGGCSNSDGWLDVWKTAYTIKEHLIVGKTGDVSEETITSFMERLRELTAGYSSENILEHGRIWLFFSKHCLIKD